MAHPTGPDFGDDGVDAIWRDASRHLGIPRAPVTIDVHPSRWAAMRACAREHPSVYLALGVVAALAAPTVFIGGFLGLSIWWLVFG